MSIIAVVREVLHDGSTGNTYLAKNDSIEEIQKNIIQRSGCESVKIIGEINDTKIMDILSVAIGINIKDQKSFSISLTWDILPPP